MPAKIGIVIQRIVFGAMAIAFLLTLFVADHIIALWAVGQSGRGAELLRRGSIIPILFVVVLALGVSEMVRLLRAKGTRPFILPAYGLTLVLVLLPWLSPAGLLGDSIADREGLYWSLAVAGGAVVLVGIACVARNNPSGTIVDGAATFLLILYLGFLGSFGLQVRCGLSGVGNRGLWLLLNIILITKCSDIGAYFVGSAIGRHKLIPAVSPGKSVEGAIGGLAASGLAAMLLAWPEGAGGVANQPVKAWWVWQAMTRSLDDVFPGEGWVMLGWAFLFGLILSMFSQLGDLFESCLKRDAGTKDSGAVMPHYGGILDLVDSPLFTLPVAWFLLTRVWNIP